jgi:hypothetical protein
VRHPSPDQLTLAALPAEPVEPDVEAHLSVCTACRAEVASLRRTVDLARTDPTVDPGPPPRVWQAILAEVSAEPAAEPAAPVRGPRPARRRLLMPVTTVAAGLVAGLAVAVTASLPPPPPEPLAQIPLTALAADAPPASGTARVVAADGARDVAVEVVVEPDGPPAGGYLEAWLMSPDATRLYSLGALAPEPGGARYRTTVRLPPDLSLDTYTTVDVSAEQLDGDPGHSGRSLLRGSTS